MSQLSWTPSTPKFGWPRALTLTSALVSGSVLLNENHARLEQTRTPVNTALLSNRYALENWWWDLVCKVPFYFLETVTRDGVDIRSKIRCVKTSRPEVM